MTSPTGLAPINADARSSVEIEDSCNCCIGLRRRQKQDNRNPKRNNPIDFGDGVVVKVKSASQPIITKADEDEWEITLGGRKIERQDSVNAFITAGPDTLGKRDSKTLTSSLHALKGME